MPGRRACLPTLACALLSPAAASACARDPAAIERAAHGAYVDAINSNDLARFIGQLTADVVFQPPGGPGIVGKPAVRAWAADCLTRYRTRWRERSIGFTVNGGRAFERYAYVSIDRDRKTGRVSKDTGRGINIFRGADGRRRVAIDGWSSNIAAAP